MKWILTFLAGALFGACALFVYFGMTPPETAPSRAPIVAAAPVVQAPVAPAPAAVPASTPAPAPSATIAASADPVTVSVPFQSAASTSAIATPPVGSDAKPADKLLIPVEGIKASQLTDTFNQSRGTERHHEALDIMAPKGTKVIAAADGKLVKLFNSKPGGLTVYEFDPTEKFAYYYAHLDRYAPGIVEGMPLKRGDLIGYVGTTGNADPGAPHLHFAIFELTPEKQWWKGTPLNPYPLLQQ